LTDIVGKISFAKPPATEPAKETPKETAKK
jgi:hypothetical protein